LGIPKRKSLAVERYDGPLWQVLRRYQREQPEHAADLVVHGLSAEYGLIAGDMCIPHYSGERNA
jgi:hypothetical protein